MVITIMRGKTQIEVHAPYHPVFSSCAKQLGGVYDHGVWVFSANDYKEIRSILDRVFPIFQKKIHQENETGGLIA